jgi:hypothetical protein
VTVITAIRFRFISSSEGAFTCFLLHALVHRKVERQKVDGPADFVTSLS